MNEPFRDFGNSRRDSKDCNHGKWSKFENPGTHLGMHPSCTECGSVGIFIPLWPDKIVLGFPLPRLKQIFCEIQNGNGAYCAYKEGHDGLHSWQVGESLSK